MGDLKLAGMRHAYDEVIADAIKRQYPAQHVVGDLLQAEIADKHARSIKYQMTIAKPPLAKEIADFEFAGTPINEALVRDLATGAFLANQRNVVLVGGTGSGKTHLSIAIRSEAHTSELQSLMRISYAVFFFKIQTDNMIYIKL